MSKQNKVDEIFEDLIVTTANAYGGFEGFEKDDKENIRNAKQEFKALVLEAIGEDNQLDMGGSKAAVDRHNDAWVQNKLRAEQRASIEELFK